MMYFGCLSMVNFGCLVGIIDGFSCFGMQVILAFILRPTVGCGFRVILPPNSLGFVFCSKCLCVLKTPSNSCTQKKFRVVTKSNYPPGDPPRFSKIAKIQNRTLPTPASGHGRQSQIVCHSLFTYCGCFVMVYFRCLSSGLFWVFMGINDLVCRWSLLLICAPARAVAFESFCPQNPFWLRLLQQIDVSSTPPAVNLP